MANHEPNPFDPANNPNMEYVPYDEDPVILSGSAEDNQAARDLVQRLRAWQDARHELRLRSDDIAAQTSVQYAEQNLEAHLAQLGLNRTVREKS